ncbi:hypothetical protein SXCC_00397 [Gluconacetobacter sp. SXCC-1]|nr:hypothetical protein SXCC_00397 [Gluconacetobacter sp. SXCC-1]
MNKKTDPNHKYLCTYRPETNLDRKALQVGPSVTTKKWNDRQYGKNSGFPIHSFASSRISKHFLQKHYC